MADRFTVNMKSTSATERLFQPSLSSGIDDKSACTYSFDYGATLRLLLVLEIELVMISVSSLSSLFQRNDYGELVTLFGHFIGCTILTVQNETLEGFTKMGYQIPEQLLGHCACLFIPSPCTASSIRLANFVFLKPRIHHTQTRLVQCQYVQYCTYLDNLSLFTGRNVHRTQWLDEASVNSQFDLLYHFQSFEIKSGNRRISVRMSILNTSSDTISSLTSMNDMMHLNSLLRYALNGLIQLSNTIHHAHFAPAVDMKVFLSRKEKFQVLFDWLSTVFYLKLSFNAKEGDLATMFFWRFGQDSIFDNKRIIACQLLKTALRLIRAIQRQIYPYRTAIYFEDEVGLMLRPMHDRDGLGFDHIVDGQAKHGKAASTSCSSLNTLNLSLVTYIKDAKTIMSSRAHKLRRNLSKIQKEVGETTHILQRCLNMPSASDRVSSCKSAVNSVEVLIVCSVPPFKISWSFASPFSTSIMPFVFLSRIIPIAIFSEFRMAQKPLFSKLLDAIGDVVYSGTCDGYISDCALFGIIRRVDNLHHHMFDSHLETELYRISNAVTCLGSNGLLILDEPCQSTGPKESDFFVWSFLEFFLQNSVKVVLKSNTPAARAFTCTYSTCSSSLNRVKKLSAKSIGTISDTDNSTSSLSSIFSPAIGERAQRLRSVFHSRLPCESAVPLQTQDRCIVKWAQSIVYHMTLAGYQQSREYVSTLFDLL